MNYLSPEESRRLNSLSREEKYYKRDMELINSAEPENELDILRAYAGKEIFTSDFQTAAEMREALNKANETVKELQETITACEKEVAEVYTELTNGKFSKMNTRAEVIIDAINRRFANDFLEDYSNPIPDHP